MSAADQRSARDPDGADPGWSDPGWAAAMAAVQAGDGPAYGRLLRDLLPVLRAMLRRWMPSPLAEDALQDVLLTLHRVRHTYDPARPFLPWLAAIAHRRAIDAMRRAGRTGAWELAQPDTLDRHPDHGVAERAETAERRDSLRSAMVSLPPRQKQALELVKLRELPVAEAARQSGQSPAAIRVNVHRAVRALRLRLQP